MMNPLKKGASNTIAIGAPFLYLPRLRDFLPAPLPNSLLVFPFHGWEEQQLIGSLEQYADAIEELVKDGYSPVTVCLYWKEYENPVNRRIFTRRGWSVVTMGHRDNNPYFLHEQRLLILRHAHVTSNRVSTATFYALYLGQPFFLHGPVMGLSASDDPTGQLFDAWQRSEFPMLSRQGYDGTAFRHIGEAELGLEYKLTPAALRRLFSWRKRDRYSPQRIYRALRRRLSICQTS